MRIPKVSFTPADRSKITLFANKGEAIVFWISVAGLIFLAIIVTFRYFTVSSMRDARSALLERQIQLQMQVEELQKQNDIFRNKLQELQMQLQRLEQQNQNLQNELKNQSAATVRTPERPRTSNVRLPDPSAQVRQIFNVRPSTSRTATK